MNGICIDNRFEIIAKVKEHLIKATNIEMCPEELAHVDNILFRLWQLGYFNQSKIEWHDLRKDPNDLPKEEGMFLFYLYDKETRDTFYEVLGVARTYADRDVMYIESMLWTFNDAIAWCEMPIYKEA